MSANSARSTGVSEDVAGAIESGFVSFEEVLEPWQVAVGVQSFIGQPLETHPRSVRDSSASA